MKTKRLVGIAVLIVFALFCFVLVAGCGEPETSTRTAGFTDTIGLPPSADPMDYFPMKVGTQWHYNVRVENTDPLTYKVMNWPVNDKTRSYSVRGLLTTENKPKDFDLTLKAVGIVSKEGPFNYPNGLAVQVVEDGLNIFRDNTGMFWVTLKTSEGGPMIMQTVTYSTDMPGGSMWGTWGVKEAYSQSIIFFGDQPLIEMSIVGDQDKLLFLGVDSIVPGCGGQACLHFRRNVDAKDVNEYISQAFAEDVWFAKGKGLVRLEQKIDGQRSMTWTLESFSLG
jgi:hypothetical protein